MTFESLGLRPDILRAIAEQGYTTPTPIQAQAIPIVLQGRDIMAGAQTGTGKTAGFTLPLLHRIAANASHSTSPAKHPVRALILTPTRELAAQVEESVKAYGKYLPVKICVIYGGVNMNPQIEALRAGIDIVVATPGRLLDHVQQRSISLNQVEFLVLDEADRMLDMGFLPDLKRIMDLLPKQRQTLLFSATFSEEIKRLSDSLLKDPVLIEVARRNTSAENVTQVAHLVDQAHKRDLLAHLVKTQDLQQVLVFTRTKHGADRLAHQLERDGIRSDAIHGDKAQSQRTKALADFKEGVIRVLVATDVAARGIDIDQLPHVFNFEMPNSPEDYIHRIGRTGRAGASGDAISLVSPEELRLLVEIEKLIKREIPKVAVEGFTPGTSAKEEPRRERPERERSDRSRDHSARRPERPELPPAAERQAQRGPNQGMPKPAANNHHLKQPMNHAISHGKKPNRPVAALLGGLNKKGD
ncbi:MAG: DEAD/DEAH box helicase [Sulfuricellaceae bacterium]|nr:DEAD/DEAH box helicase [Sulfuricellaceae bacterium]